MKYKTMRITTTADGAEWTVYIASVETNGPMPESTPTAQGTFCYGMDMSDDEAFVLLKAKMVKSHQDEIARFQGSLEKLLKIELPGAASETEATPEEAAKETVDESPEEEAVEGDAEEK